MELNINTTVLSELEKLDINLIDLLVLETIKIEDKEIMSYFLDINKKNLQYMLSLQKMERFGFIVIEENENENLYKLTETGYILTNFSI